MKKLLYMLSIISVTVLASCSGGGEENDVYLEVSPLTMDYNEINTAANVITIKTNASWIATSSSAAMIIDKNRGSAGESTITVTSMRVGETQTITIETTSGSYKSQTVTVVSKSDATNATGWAEMPKRVENDNYVYVTHTAALNGKEVRNYSFCYDKTKYAALWVAYPLHSCYTSGSGDRNNSNWKYDPSMDSSFQPSITSGSYPGQVYQRGHQIPAADRKATQDFMDQTFYASNSAPQLAAFNTGAWEDLEMAMRSSYMCSDTLYVVTGCYFAEGYTTTPDRAPKDCPVPTNYFKILLRTKSGSSGKSIGECSSGELKAVGFWFNHSSTTSSLASSLKTVAEIEDLTGFEFFTTIPEAVKESYTASEWGL